MRLPGPMMAYRALRSTESVIVKYKKLQSVSLAFRVRSTVVRMGTGVSAAQAPGGELRLPESKLRFSAAQLSALNQHVAALAEINRSGGMPVELENTVESLVQRIVDGAGQKDPRFRCCHLIALHRDKRMRSRSLEYLVTLDSMPTLNSEDEECFLEEGPVGYGRVRLAGRLAERWADFLTPAGFLCRDKVVERWVQLVASCAHARGGSGGPRVLCVRAATKAMPYQYCYLERSQTSGAHTEHRLAIVEGSAWVMVRVGAGEAEAKLVLGVRSAPLASCLRRLPLTHPLALLYYSAAQTEMYAVAIGPPTSLACAERQAAWQLWHPALEATLDTHSGELSAPGQVAAALNALLDRLRDGVVQGSVRALSRYAVWCALRRRLERCGGLGTAATRCCLAAHASHHLLLVIDSLIGVCENRSPAGYVYPTERGSVARRGARLPDAEWRADAHCLRAYLAHLHSSTAKAEEIPPSPSETLELVLFRRWESVVRESRGQVGHTPSYSRRQLSYIWRLSKELLNARNTAVYENHSAFRANLIQATSTNEEPIEDLIHILAIFLDQARDSYLQSNFPQTTASSNFDREHANYRSKKWNKLKDYYDASSACLIDTVRRDPDLKNEDFSDETNIIKGILNWLYKGAKEDRKYLGPVLKPFLDCLYGSSLENSWFLEDFDSKKCIMEFEGLKDYCMGVHDGKIDPCMGLLDAAKKLGWAKAMVDFIDRSKHVGLRLIFPTGDGLALSHPVQLPARQHHPARLLTLSRRDKAEAKLRLARRCVLAAFAGALQGERTIKQANISRQGSTDEILASVQIGRYWRNNTKPDIITNASLNQNPDRQTKDRRRSRRSRPATAYGFPEISITNQSDVKGMRKKYHTLKSLVYTEPVESIKDIRERPRSAGSTMRVKESMSRPTILETLDFINGVKDALCVEESGASDVEESAWGSEDDWLMGQTAPLNVLARLSAGDNQYLALGDLIVALLHRGKFTVLQELCGWLGESREGALFALHRLARAARSRSSERTNNAWKLPESQDAGLEVTQTYRARHPDYFSGDESSQPVAIKHRQINGNDTQIPPKHRHSDFLPPRRLQELQDHISQLEIIHSKLNSQDVKNSTPHKSTSLLNESYTGIINPIYDLKIPKDKFTTKRSKSLGRSTSTRRPGLEAARYNITLGYKSGQRTNDVVRAISSVTGTTGLDPKVNFFQKYNSASNIVGDSYKISRVSID